MRRGFLKMLIRSLRGVVISYLLGGFSNLKLEKANKPLMALMLPNFWGQNIVSER
jgi:hypothetical protein